MHTRCPECQTTFSITEAELDAHQGLVRCGECEAVFDARRNMVQAPHTRQNEAQTPASREPSAEEASGTGPQHIPVQLGFDEDIEQPPVDEAPSTRSEPILSLPGAKARPFVSSASWLLGNAVLLVVLIGQIAYSYSSELARRPGLETVVRNMCDVLGCEVRPRQDIRLVELARTSVAPHPERAHALRIKASLVNRADFTQPYPLMEVSLSDSAGKILARKAFKPHEYLQGPGVDAGMPPNVAVSVRLDITSPNPSAVGYEIQLVR